MPLDNSNFDYNGTGYSLINGGILTDENLIIPEFWDDGINGFLPVTKVSDYFMPPYSFNYNIKTITFPKSINYVGAYAFAFALNITKLIFLGDKPEFNFNSLGYMYFDLKIYRKKYFVSGWPPIGDALPGVSVAYVVVDIQSNNIINCSNGIGTLTTQKRN